MLHLQEKLILDNIYINPAAKSSKIAALGVLQRVLPTKAAIWIHKGIHRIETIYADQ